MRRYCLILVAVFLLGAHVPAASAQTAERCFLETGYCISGRMREFWEQNGGLPVFGFPITPLQTEQVEGKPVQVQWFERNRLELHPGNKRPYDVLLGRLGATRSTVAPATTPTAGCMSFAQTGQEICGEILTAWRASGLELDGRAGKTEGENLALFGLPLTPLRTEQLADGKSYQVQWFERARFEVHPENSASRVLLGLLGREAGPVAKAPEREPQPKQSASAPARINISAIDMSYPVVPVGLDRNGAPIVLDHDVAWYNQSARPGQGNNIVFWAHVLRFRTAPDIPAPFARVKELKPGARITLTASDGTVHTYAVTRQLEVTPDQVKYILPTGKEQVTLVSCYGDQVIKGGEVVDMTKRLITIAEPVQ